MGQVFFSSRVLTGFFLFEGCFHCYQTVIENELIFTVYT